MVGGLADWFAVTALFRHPLGIPIPHTAIVAQRKDRIGRSLGNFVGNNFLAREVIARQLAGMQARRARGAVAVGSRSTRRASRARSPAASRGRPNRCPTTSCARACTRRSSAQLRKAHVAPLLGDLLALATTDDRHQEMLDRLVRLVSRVVRDNKELIRHRIAEESPWWVPDAVDDKLYQKIVAGIERTLEEVCGRRRSSAARAVRPRAAGLHREAAQLAGDDRARRGDEGAAARASGGGRAVRRAARRGAQRRSRSTPDRMRRRRSRSSARSASIAERALANEALLQDVDEASSGSCSASSISIGRRWPR